MKYELTKKLEPMGDVYYHIRQDGQILNDLTTYGGNALTSDPEYFEKKRKHAEQIFDGLIAGKIAPVPIITLLKEAAIPLSVDNS